MARRLGRVVMVIGGLSAAACAIGHVEEPAPSVVEVRRSILAGPAQVEGLDERGAWLLPLDGSPGVMVRRSELPPEVREGDVIQGGKVDRQATAQLHAWVRQKLAQIDRAGRPIPLGRPPLTHR